MSGIDAFQGLSLLVVNFTEMISIFSLDFSAVAMMIVDTIQINLNDSWLSTYE